MTRDPYTWTADVACSAFTGLLLLLTLAFHRRLPEWPALALKFALALAVYTAATWWLRRLRPGFAAVALRTAVVIGLLALIFGAVADLQHILVRGWKDGALLAFERAAIGVDSTVWLQRWTLPAITEIMMFAYVIYIPMLPGVSLLCYRSAGAHASYDYLLNLSLVNIVCTVGFILYPVASPLYYQPQLYTVPLRGSIFTWCGEWVRHHAHYAGGSLPSPHCAAGSVMLAMLYRYDKRSFRVALPIVLVLYVSTVYGRYHYVSDAVTGILTAIAMLALSTKGLSGNNRTSSARALPDGRGSESGSEPRP